MQAGCILVLLGWNPASRISLNLYYSEIRDIQLEWRIDMFYYTVWVKDRQTGAEVCVGDLLSQSEATRIKRALEATNACDVLVCTAQFYTPRGSEYGHI